MSEHLKASEIAYVASLTSMTRADIAVAARVNAHIAECAECRALYNAALKLTDALGAYDDADACAVVEERTELAAMARCGGLKTRAQKPEAALTLLLGAVTQLTPLAPYADAGESVIRQGEYVERCCTLAHPERGELEVCICGAEVSVTCAGALSAALIMSAGVEHTATPDEAGRAHFTGLQAGEYTLKLSFDKA